MAAPLRHHLELFTCAVLFSTAGAAIKACSLGSWQVAGFRAGIAAAAFLVLVPASRRRRWTWRTLLVGAGLAATVICFVTANKLTTAGSAIFLQASSPLWLAIASPVLGDRVRRRDLLLLPVLALAMGLFFVGAPAASASAPDPLLGNLLAALSGVLAAGMIAGLRWLSRAEGSSAPAVVAGNLIAFVVCLPFALPAQGSAADWLILTYLGVFQIAVAYALLTSALAHVGALEACLLLFLEPALSPVWAYLVHGEEPGLAAIAGGLLILAATAAKTLLDLREPSSM